MATTSGPRRIVPTVDFVARGLAPVVGAPVPNLQNHGGPVIGSVEVVPIYWGAAWATGTNAVLASNIDRFFDFIVTSSYMDLLHEYSTPSTQIQHGRRLASANVANSEPGTVTPSGRQVTDDQIRTALQGWIANHTVPATTANTLYFIYLPPNVVSLSFGSSSCVAGGFCGYHDHIGNIYYAVIPYVNCPGCVFAGQFLDTLTEVSSHELAEAITDPELNAWWDPVTGPGDEIGDICNRQTTRLGDFVVQTEWSNTQGACVVAPAPALQVPSPSVVTDLTRFRDHIDLFVVGFDGGVNSTFWDANGGWFNRWFRIIDPNFSDLFTVPPQSVVTCLTRFQDHIDLFAVGRDSAVYSTFWDANGGWFNHWFRLLDTNFSDGFKVPQQSTVSSLSRFRDHIDLFVVGFDGGVYSTFWDANGGWFNHWFRLIDTNFGDHFTVPQQSTVSCLSRFQNHIDLFVTGQDGGVYSTFWDANGGWFNHWFRLIDTNFGDGFTVPPKSTVSCLSRFQDHIDLFVTGRDGVVYSTFWDASSGWFNHWFGLRDTNFHDGFTVPPGSPISCLSRFRDHIDLFVVGFDGGVYSTFWDASSGWFNHWFRLPDTNFGDGFTVPPGSVVSSMSRFQDHIDLFVTGRDGGVYSTFWDANGGWFNHWFRI
jgi:hypothetical protein